MEDQRQLTVSPMGTITTTSLLAPHLYSPAKTKNEAQVFLSILFIYVPEHVKFIGWVLTLIALRALTLSMNIASVFIFYISSVTYKHIP